MAAIEQLKTWKEVMQELQEGASANDAVIEKVSEELKALEEKNRQEIEKMADKIREQAKSLRELLETVQADELYLIPAEQENRESYISSLQNALSRSQMLLRKTENLLGAKPAEAAKDEEASQSAAKAKEEPVIPPFPQAALLGNWIHYFHKDMFTCQCFWADGEFKEYDFKDGELVEERSGSYKIEDHDVKLRYQDGKTAVYTVTGYSVDCLDYLIEDTAIRFDYMPEDLLNSLLEENADKLMRM